MRILHLSAAFDLNDRSAGGVATHVSTLARGLTRPPSQFKVHVVTKSRNDNPNRTRKEGVTIWEVPNREVPNFFGRRAPLDDLLEFVMRRWIEISPDIIHAHDFDSIYIGWLLKVAFKRKLVATLHRAPSEWKNAEHQESPKACFMEAMRLFELTDGIIIPSEFSLRVLLRQGFKLRNAGPLLRVIPHGLSKKIRSYRYQQQIIEDLNLSAETIFIICPSRLDHHKDPYTFLRAAGKLKERLPKRKLVFLLCADREDSDFEYVVKLAGINGLDIDKDLWLRRYSHHDMATIYRRAQICVIPSRRESFGQTVVESFLLRVPVIAANAGALKEVVVHNASGLHFTDGNDDELVQRMVQLIESPTLVQTLISAGEREADTKFSVEKMTQQYERYYEEILAPRK